jgi:hypothetical protein
LERRYGGKFIPRPLPKKTKRSVQKFNSNNKKMNKKKKKSFSVNANEL